MSDNINWRRVDLNLLLTFDALYKHRSVSAAAKHLHLGQPATSYNLKRLRELLDDPLFERGGSSMTPTTRAMEIEPKVRQILSIFSQDIMPKAAFEADSFDGTFRIGLSDYAEQVYGPELFDKLQQLAPNAKVLFKPVDVSNCVEALEKQEVDLCIGVFSDLPPKVSSTFLYREKHLCIFDNRVLGSEHPLSLETYLATPQMIITASQELTTKVDATLSNMGVKRNVVLGSTRFLTIRRMLTGRRLLAVMAEMVGRVELIDDNLTLCPPPINIPDFDIEMVTLTRDSHHPRILWLSDWVKEVIQHKVAALQTTSN
ncbi:LysR substrate-binding domain-containing protein [Vibrio coralliilyticus]|uniref:LysR substrate-binding domain-containing protein n=1 Tax=Vibrio coralliilyticus TaxID=190893 RepID=UPI0015605A02|nr:LysR substrate-binding domain-containing protein [Vibrio coralliilyticus]NRF64349.1 LysR family transcriptional regulator [Vibrio coralliilyticus]